MKVLKLITNKDQKPRHTNKTDYQLRGLSQPAQLSFQPLPEGQKDSGGSHLRQGRFINKGIRFINLKNRFWENKTQNTEI